MVLAAFLAKDSASLVVNKLEKALLLRNARMNCLADEVHNVCNGPCKNYYTYFNFNS
jgi:hypothetical protein